jgi:hypothetical protein
LHDRCHNKDKTGMKIKDLLPKFPLFTTKSRPTLFMKLSFLNKAFIRCPSVQVGFDLPRNKNNTNVLHCHIYKETTSGTHEPESLTWISVLSRTEKGHGIFFLKGHFAHRIYQKGHIEKIG